MKTAGMISLIIIFALAFTSCVMVVKDKPADDTQVRMMGSFAKIDAPHAVKMFRHQGGKGKGFRTIESGKSVRVIKAGCPFSLVAAPNGDTGWVKCKWIK